MLVTYDAPVDSVGRQELFKGEFTYLARLSIPQEVVRGCSSVYAAPLLHQMGTTLSEEVTWPAHKSFS